MSRGATIREIRVINGKQCAVIPLHVAQRLAAGVVRAAT